MDEITFFDKLKKITETRKEQIQDTLMSGSLKDIEHYKYLQGELSALYYVENEIKEFYKVQ
tara:strand:+ start:108 stop:290 length:183 start_codon:yes stop_codon:yes gene_type:complete